MKRVGCPADLRNPVFSGRLFHLPHTYAAEQDGFVVEGTRRPVYLALVDSTLYLFDHEEVS